MTQLTPAGGPHGTRAARALRVLPFLTLLAVLTITASAEYQLARTVLDLQPAIAWALPAAIDSYVLAALRRGRDVASALTVMAGALTASMGAHLANAAHPSTGLPGTLTAPLATAIMTVLVVVAWRVHVLIDDPAAAPIEASTPNPIAGGAAAHAAPHPVLAPRPDLTDETASGRRALARPAARPPRAVPAGNRGYDDPEPLSDAEILAAITSETPSIRALMRTHGIGQARATRLHRTATATAAAGVVRTVITAPAANDTTRPRQDQHSHNGSNTTGGTIEQNAPRRTSKIETTGMNEDDEDDEDDETNEDQKCQEGAQDRAHTCITDRVGQPRSTKNGLDLDGGGDSIALPTELDEPLFDLDRAATPSAEGA